MSISPADLVSAASVAAAAAVGRSAAAVWPGGPRLDVYVEFGLGLTGITTIPADASDHALALVS